VTELAEGSAPSNPGLNLVIKLGSPDSALKNPPELMNQGSADIYKNYPVFPAGSVEINNLRYWKTPNNGKCSPAEFCGAYYNEKQMPINTLLAPNPEWGKERVNYYMS